MNFSAAELSEFLNGELIGNPQQKITNLAKIEEGDEGSVSFIANPKYEPFAYTTNCSVLLVSKDFQPQKQIKPTLIKVEDPYSSFVKLLEKENLHRQKKGKEEPVFIHSSASVSGDAFIGAFTYIAANARIHKNAQIHPQCYIGEGVEIGENTVIFAGVKIYDNCKIGAECIIYSGCVIGSDGFGFAPQKDGSYKKIPQLGNVIIEDEVEIGANSAIDRATIGSTVIKRGVKLDNLIQVAHNAEIGENTLIAAQTGVSGSAKLGKNCMIGGQVGFVGHISIAPGSKINAQSGVSKSIKDAGKAWTGSPAFEYREALKSQVLFKNLPQIEQRIKNLEKAVKKDER